MPDRNELIKKIFAITVISTFVLGGCAISAKKEPPPEAVATPAPVIQDSDGDGVPDGVDECPNTRAGATVDDRGCEILGTLENAHFEFDSSVLTDKARMILDKVAMVIKGVSGRKFEVAGHTDSKGSDEYNSGLGERRAVSVVEYMTSMGVSPSKLQLHSYGESKPIASNDTEDGRAMNRRVEIIEQPM
ncbi:MAG: OOP family OmpA-OmpF porin [Parasphingorhabdus sp.]|jgi:OOP family OmpA-OmpF porin